MRREISAPRPALEARLRELNMWPAEGAPYYDEGAAYVFTEAQVETLYEATAELEDRKSTRLNSSHRNTSRMPSSA